MKVGIMQPYLFPYLGYFQLINAVDLFVIYDDVQYIKGGWINRNKILVNGKESSFVISVQKDQLYKNINERFYSNKFEYEKEKFLKTIEFAYKGAPFFYDVDNLMKEIFIYKSLNVSEFNTNSIKLICNYLGIHTKIILSSNINKNSDLKSEERVININQCLKSNWYINPIGGVELYSAKNFEQNGLKLNFIKMKNVSYKQFQKEFIGNLSIIDVLMFNSKENVRYLLNEYEFI